MPQDDDLQGLEDDLIFITLLADDQENADRGWGCGGCLATGLVFVAALVLLGLAVDWLMPLLGGR